MYLDLITVYKCFSSIWNVLEGFYLYKELILFIDLADVISFVKTIIFNIPDTRNQNKTTRHEETAGHIDTDKSIVISYCEKNDESAQYGDCKLRRTQTQPKRPTIKTCQLRKIEKDSMNTIVEKNR